MTLNAPASPSNDQTPAFTGTASATTNVVVHIYEGTKAEGTQLASATVKGTGGAFTTGEAGPALPSGKRTFAAQATQESPLGNPEGKSNVVTFVVNTNPPTVTLNAITTPTGNTTPSFSGTASETQPVTVKIYKGSEAKGTPFAVAEAPVELRKMGPRQLHDGRSVEGEYTAVALEPSSLGNAEGKSSAIKFVVITKPPTVTLDRSRIAIQGHDAVLQRHHDRHADGDRQGLQRHESRRHRAGNARSDAEKRQLLDGCREKSARPTASTRRWRPSPARSGTRRGRATRSPSSSTPARRQVTLNAVPTPSNNTTPSFSGTASESEPVTVKIYKGAKAEGTVVASVEAEVSSRNWGPSALGKALASGEYTAQAVEPSSIGNATGKSEPRTFVVNTEPPEVTLSRGADAVERHDARPSAGRRANRCR